MAAAAAVAPIAGSLIGNAMSGGDKDAAQRAFTQAQQIIAQIPVPTEESLKVVLRQLESQGQLTPELESALTQQASGLQSYQEDQQLKQTQRDALQSLIQSGRTGLSATDRAALNQIRNQTAQQVQAQEQSVLQNMQMRGMGGSGNELAARLLAGQAGAQSAQQQGDQIAAQAQQNALQAMAQSGNLASGMSQADFSRASQIAQAQDAINRFNTENSQNVAGRNVSSKNTAQATNLGEKQRVADTNVGTYNSQEQYNKQVPMQVYNAQLQKANLMSGLANQQGYRDLQSAKDTEAMWSKMGSGAGDAIGTFGSGGAGGAAAAKK